MQRTSQFGKLGGDVQRVVVAAQSIQGSLGGGGGLLEGGIGGTAGEADRRLSGGCGVWRV